ncbi:MAG TPA: glycine cleavage T C-terminal barrel domain-containing protein, partial [Burkholderiales bacterium]
GVAGVLLRSLQGGGHAARVACDGVVMSVGWAPAANLLYQAGTRMRYDPGLEQFIPESLPEGVFACGRVNGVYDAAQKLRDGERAGRAAAAHAGHGAAAAIPVAPEAESPSHSWPIVEHPKGKNFVDFDEDLQLRDFANAAQEGFDNIELLKRYTTVGMGPSQGKHSNMNALRILARLTGKPAGEVGTTTARPFVHPVPLSHLAGRGFSPERLTPLHSRHAALGAVFMPAGVWQRPAYYAAEGADREQAIRGEALAVREAAGVIDVGTLGKLEVRGPDAAEFLERVYTGRFANQPVGTTRYALMCDEAGTIVDDGIVARFAPDRFYFTTSTVNGPLIYRELSRLNTLWRLDCALVNLTGALAAVNLAGPRAREILAGLSALDLSAAAFPFLGAREGEVAGISARLMRVGFVGEWGYEIHVPAAYGGALWDALMAAGATRGIRPFGVEAQRLLRLEKGHIIVGQDTDGLTTPMEAGMGWALKMDKPFFVGQRSLRILGGRALRQSLAGFTLAPDFSGAAPNECHLVIEGSEIAGRVTSIAWSPALGRHVGLAMVRPGLASAGNSLQIRLSDGMIWSGRR